MRRYYLIVIIFLSLTSQILPQSWYPLTIDNKQRHPFTEVADTIDNKESRTIVNKTILNNGFLLIEELWQDWDGSNWVNDWMYTYTYDVNNNMIEQIYQGLGGSNWENDWV